MFKYLCELYLNLVFEIALTELLNTHIIQYYLLLCTFCSLTAALSFHM